MSYLRTDIRIDFPSRRFFQKTNEWIRVFCLTVQKTNLFVRFLEESEDTKKSFRSYLTFTSQQFIYYSSYLKCFSRHSYLGAESVGCGLFFELNRLLCTTKAVISLHQPFFLKCNQKISSFCYSACNKGNASFGLHMRKKRLMQGYNFFTTEIPMQ